jgi:hypothetical protein
VKLYKNCYTLKEPQEAEQKKGDKKKQKNENVKANRELVSSEKLGTFHQGLDWFFSHRVYYAYLDSVRGNYSSTYRWESF